MATVAAEEPRVPQAPKEPKVELRSHRGAKLASRTWGPSSRKTPPRAVLVIVHGGGWHSGYFDGIATYLVNELNLYVVAYDQPGCGYSEKEPSAPEGTFHFSFDDLIDDVFVVVDWAAREYVATNSASSSFTVSDMEKLPLFFLGESFGGAQVLRAAFEAKMRNVPLAGVICLGAAVKVAPNLLPPAPVLVLLRFLARYYPKIVMPATDMGSTFDAAFGDQRWAKIARSDQPYICVSPRPTLGAAATMLSSGEQVMAEASEFPTPFLAIHGKRDCRTLASGVQELVDRMGGAPKAQLILVETDGHQLLQDTPKNIQFVKKHVRDWIDQLLS